MGFTEQKWKELIRKQNKNYGSTKTFNTIKFEQAPRSVFNPYLGVTKVFVHLQDLMVQLDPEVYGLHEILVNNSICEKFHSMYKKKYILIFSLAHL